jgi:hypothetical protein
MKKNFKILSLAVIAMLTAAACNNNAAEVEAIDTVIPVDTMIVDSIVADTMVVEEPVAQEPVKTAKKAPKKKETVVEKKSNDRPVNIEVNKGKIKVRTEENTSNLQKSEKEAKETDRPIEIKTNKKIGNRPVNVTVKE